MSSLRQQCKNSERLDEYAWFSDINYQLVVAPYIAAMNSGLLPPTTIAPPQSNDRSKFPTTYDTIDPELANDWTEYFETIKILQVDSSYISYENLLKMLWAVHTKTLTKTLPKFELELRLLNPKERKFANGFGYFVEIPATINLETSYDVIIKLNKVFPRRVLKISDTPPLIPDMTVEQNIIVAIFFMIDEMSKVPIVWERFLDMVRNMISYSKF